MNEFNAWPIVNIVSVIYSHYSIFDKTLSFLSLSINFSGNNTVLLTINTMLYSRPLELTHFCISKTLYLLNNNCWFTPSHQPLVTTQQLWFWVFSCSPIIYVKSCFCVCVCVRNATYMPATKLFYVHSLFEESQQHYVFSVVISAL